MHAKEYPSHQSLILTFDYDQKLGLLLWKNRRHNQVTAGTPAGSINGAKRRINPYRLIWFNGEFYLASRLIWVFHNGPIKPNDEIDHINGCSTDDRIENLRIVNRTQNLQNRPLTARNKYGCPGIQKIPSRLSQWRSVIKVYKKSICLGHYKSLEEAIIARKMGEELYAFHKNHGQHRQ